MLYLIIVVIFVYTCNKKVFKKNLAIILPDRWSFVFTIH